MAIVATKLDVSSRATGLISEYLIAIKISFKHLLFQFFEIMSVPVDSRISALRAWEASVKQCLKEDPSVIELIHNM